LLVAGLGEWLKVKGLRASISILSALLLVWLIGGCAAWVTRFDQFPQHRQMVPMPSGPICRVAVLPFENDSDYPLGDAIFAKVLTAQLNSAGNYLIIQEGDILKVYQQLRILPGKVPTAEQLQIIAGRLDAQLLVTGTVIEMREDRAQHATVNPLVAVDILLRDGASSEPLWGTYHRRQGSDYRTAMHFGMFHTVTGLSHQVTTEIINLWYEKGLPRCDVSPRS
jgi:hypothetical protein